MLSSQTSAPLKNQLLAALLNAEYQHLRPHLTPVRLGLGDVIYSAGRKIESVYFPETAVVSLLSTLESGETTEVGVVGREGMVGLSIFLGGAVTPELAVVQLAGTALKMKSVILKNELKVGGSLQLQLFRYTRSFLTLIAQSVACSQHHSLEARFARWLLMMHDYSDSNTLRVTHEMVAGMIGSRRAGVSMATRALREQKLITNIRGAITIIDRPALERVACECYLIIRNEFQDLHENQMGHYAVSVL